MQARRDFEDQFAALGQQRAKLNAEIAVNTGTIKELLGAALTAGVTMETLAQLSGVSRQTLHQWRNEQLTLAERFVGRK